MGKARPHGRLRLEEIYFVKGPFRRRNECRKMMKRCVWNLIHLWTRCVNGPQIRITVIFLIYVDWILELPYTVGRTKYNECWTHCTYCIINILNRHFLSIRTYFSFPIREEYWAPSPADTARWSADRWSGWESAGGLPPQTWPRVRTPRGFATRSFFRLPCSGLTAWLAAWLSAQVRCSLMLLWRWCLTLLM